MEKHEFDLVALILQKIGSGTRKATNPADYPDYNEEEVWDILKKLIRRKIIGGKIETTISGDEFIYPNGTLTGKGDEYLDKINQGISPSTIFAGLNTESLIEPLSIPNQGELRKLISKNFDKNAIKILCFDLLIDYEQFSGTGKDVIIVELITSCIQTNRLSKLIYELRELRPDVEWPNVLQNKSPK